MITPTNPAARAWSARLQPSNTGVAVTPADGKPLTDADVAYVQAALDAYNPNFVDVVPPMGGVRGFVDAPIAGQPFPGQRGAVGPAQVEVDNLDA